MSDRIIADMRLCASPDAKDCEKCSHVDDDNHCANSLMKEALSVIDDLLDRNKILENKLKEKEESVNA